MPRLVAAAIAVLCLFVTASAWGHVERPAYWPDPAADTSITPATGGKVPKARSLRSSVRKKPPGQTRVVCQPDSMKLLRASIRRARRNGSEVRPSDIRRVDVRNARRLLRINKKLKRMCRFSEIQPAVE